MPKARLTDTRIAAHTHADGEWLSDTASNLVVRVRKSGSKSFVFRGMLRYREVRISIGEVGPVSLPEARRQALEWQGMIEKGEDPREVLRQAEEAKAQAEAERLAAQRAREEAAQRELEDRQRFTLHALCDAYADHLEAKGKTSARDCRSVFKVHVFEVRRDLAKIPARDITADDIAALVRAVQEKGKTRTAGVLRSYLLAAFNAASRARYDSTLPSHLIGFGVTTNPAAVIPSIPIEAGTRALSAAELRVYLDALTDTLPDQALLLAILSGGQRMEQLLRAKVSDWTPETATLRLWDGKGKRRSPREHLLPLAPRAAALVEALIERAQVLSEKNPESGPPLLFSSYGKVQMDAITPSKRLKDISTAMGGEPFTLRDLRRTCETMLAGMGVSRDTRAQLLSHGISGVQAVHYDRHEYMGEKRAALVAWERRLEEVQNGQNAHTNVVPMTRAA
jgi:integrase